MVSSQIKCIDVETPIKNSGHPFTPENRMVSWACASTERVPTFHYYREADFISELENELEQCDEYVNFQCKFDLLWFARHDIYLSPETKVWDCMLAEFVLAGQTNGFISLDEALESYGLPPKQDKVKEFWDRGIDTNDIPVDILKEYNVIDVQGALMLRHEQQKLMTPEQINLVYLLGEDLKCLVEMELAGVKWDAKGASRTVEENKATIREYTDVLNSYLPTIPHGEFNWDSGLHLSCFLYGGKVEFKYSIPETTIYKSGEKKGTPRVVNHHFVDVVDFPGFFRPLKKTMLKRSKDEDETKYYSTDVPTLKQLAATSNTKKTIIRCLLERSDKIKVTEMLESIAKRFEDLGWNDEAIHCQFNQNVVVTGRLSSSKPNMQNTPLEVDRFLVSRYD